MRDRELIELAAKALGLRVTGWASKNGVEVAVLDDESYFQPIHDNDITCTDADAFRLAAKLGMCLDLRHGKSWAAFTDNPDSAIGDYMGANESHNGDELKATRRAITRAAAEIGKEMGK